MSDNRPLVVDSLLFVRLQPEELIDQTLPVAKEWEVYNDSQVASDTLHALWKQKRQTDPRVKYLINKCWEKDIFICTTDELGPDYLCIYDSKKGIAYY